MSKKRKPMATDTLEPLRPVITKERVEFDEQFAAVASELGRKAAIAQTESIVTVVYTHEPRARSRTFTAKPCTACLALRNPETNFTRVYATRGNVRYCRCHYCGNTWKDSSD